MENLNELLIAHAEAVAKADNQEVIQSFNLFIEELNNWFESYAEMQGFVNLFLMKATQKAPAEQGIILKYVKNNE